MMTSRLTVLCTTIAVTVMMATSSAQSTGRSPAKEGLETLKALEGEWIDLDGVFGTKGAVAVTYKVTSGGHTVVETFPVNSGQDMVTVYHLDGNDLVLTHYCSSGNQPRMRSEGLDGGALIFDFDGGSNVDPARTSHMHAVKIEFVSADEVRSTWQNWKDGRPAGQNAVFRIARRK